MNVYINQVDDGLGTADVWDGVLASHGPMDGPNDANEPDRISESYG